MRRVVGEADIQEVEAEVHSILLLYYPLQFEAELGHIFLLVEVPMFLTITAQEFLDRFSPIKAVDKLVCQVCKKRGHEALDCWHRFDNAMYLSSPQTFFNSTISNPNEGWFLNSGASHHVTSDLNYLTSFHAYDGQDRL
jgi:hypothetical protein